MNEFRVTNFSYGTFLNRYCRTDSKILDEERVMFPIGLKRGDQEYRGNSTINMTPTLTRKEKA